MTLNNPKGRLTGRKVSKLEVACFIALGVSTLALLGAMVFGTYRKDTPICANWCRTGLAVNSALVTAEGTIAEYENDACHQKLKAAKEELEELNFYKKLKGKPCGAGLEATLASTRRLLITRGSDIRTLDWIIHTLRLSCSIADSTRRMKELTKR